MAPLNGGGGGEAARLERELALARVPFDVLVAAGPAHKVRNLAERLLKLQQRITSLERQLAPKSANHEKTSPPGRYDRS